jgi:hypothetical protein
VVNTNFWYFLFLNVFFFFIEEDEDDKSLTPNIAIHSDNSTSTSGILRSKDLRSVVETKRRNFSRSRSSSDSEDNGSSYDMTRSSNRKRTRSPNSLHEESLTNTHPHRDRSYSNIEHILGEIPFHIQQQIILNNSEGVKRRSFSRAGSIASTNRLTLSGTHEDINTDLSGTNSLQLITDRTRSLSIDHRLGNPSQMSIASRTSIRYSTPRESTVFTKNDAPKVIRVLQQTPHHDTTDAIRIIIEHQRSEQISSNEEHSSRAIIIEEDISPPSNIKSPISKKMSNGVSKSSILVPCIANVNRSNGHLASQHSVWSTLKYSLIKRQEHRKSNVNEKAKHTGNNNRACCTIL